MQAWSEFWNLHRTQTLRKYHTTSDEISKKKGKDCVFKHCWVYISTVYVILLQRWFSFFHRINVLLPPFVWFISTILFGLFINVINVWLQDKLCSSGIVWYYILSDKKEILVHKEVVNMHLYLKRYILLYLF